MDSWDEIRGLILGGDLPAADYLPAAARAAGLLLVLPGWSSLLVPARFRWAFAAVLVFLVARPGPAAVALPGDLPSAALLLLGEGLLGAALGWGMLIVLAAARAAGSYIGHQIGLSLGGAMDPAGETGEPALRGFLALFAIHTFLSLDLHHASLRAATLSFDLFPPGSWLAPEAFSRLAQAFLGQAGILFTAALALAFPVTAALLLAGLVQGIASRVFPQMEFLLFGFPARALAGLAVLGLSLPWIAGLYERLFTAVTGETVLEALKG